MLAATLPGPPKTALPATDRGPGGGDFRGIVGLDAAVHFQIGCRTAGVEHGP